MKSLALSIPWALALLVPWRVAAQAEQPAPARTYALLFASNQGGPGQQALRYAEDDADKVQDVLTSLAGYDPSRVRKVIAPSAQQMRDALARLHDQLAADARSGEQSVVFLYYSGHARADALSLGGETMPLDELRERVTALPATLSIVVLDACQSGAFSRVKGASAASDFSFNSVQRLNTRGIAVMASSSGVELSQESDELKSSYFTHHLLVALRGGADVDRDGQVTLAEAYKYAYDHTLAQTATTTVGEQHVTLETDFRGKGDVPITYPAKASSRLLIPADFAGKLLLQKLPSWSVLAELQKTPGDPVELALPAGQYAATVRRDGSAERCSLRIDDGAASTLDLSASGCSPLVDDEARAKGGESADAEPKGHEGFSLELLVGLASDHGDGPYAHRLTEFGFEEGTHSVGRYHVGVGRRLFDHFVIGLTFGNLDAADYTRLNDEAGEQTFEWESYEAGGYLQADASFGRRRILTPYARAGGGVAYGWTSLDAVVSDPEFMDSNASFEDTTADTHSVERSFSGVHVWGALGLIIGTRENVAFQFELRYGVAPVLDNRLGESYDVGGWGFIGGLRLRTWE
jgi:hypothetical protein